MTFLKGSCSVLMGAAVASLSASSIPFRSVLRCEITTPVLTEIKIIKLANASSFFFSISSAFVLLFSSLFFSSSPLIPFSSSPLLLSTFRSVFYVRDVLGELFLFFSSLFLCPSSFFSPLPSVPLLPSSSPPLLPSPPPPLPFSPSLLSTFRSMFDVFDIL